jgi:hypothetical protein
VLAIAFRDALHVGSRDVVRADVRHVDDHDRHAGGERDRFRNRHREPDFREAVGRTTGEELRRRRESQEDESGLACAHRGQ